MSSPSSKDAMNDRTHGRRDENDAVKSNNNQLVALPTKTRTTRTLASLTCYSKISLRMVTLEQRSRHRQVKVRIIIII